MEALRRLLGSLGQHGHQQQFAQQTDFADSSSNGEEEEQQQQYERVKRSSWPASAVLQRPAPPPPFLHWFDRQLLAGLLCILLVAWLCTATDYGVSPRLQHTTAHLASPFSTSYASIAVHSTVLDVDPAAEVMLLELQVQRRGPAVAEACGAWNAPDFQLSVGTATPVGARPAAVIPLCPPPNSASSSGGVVSAGDYAVYRVSVPIRQTNMLASPWEELSGDVRLALRCAGAGCLGREVPGVTWTAHWASSKMVLDLERHMLVDKVPLLDAAAAYPIADEGSAGLLEALGLHMQVPEAVFRVQMRRHPGIRSIQLLVALGQIGFISYCLMMGAGQVLWAYVLARFLGLGSHHAPARRRTSVE